MIDKTVGLRSWCNVQMKDIKLGVLGGGWEEGTTKADNYYLWSKSWRARLGKLLRGLTAAQRLQGLIPDSKGCAKIKRCYHLARPTGLGASKVTRSKSWGRGRPRGACFPAGGKVRIKLLGDKHPSFWLAMSGAKDNSMDGHAGELRKTRGTINYPVSTLPSLCVLQGRAGLKLPILLPQPAKY